MKQHITQALADRLKPRTRDYFIWDTELTGFGVKMTPAGRRSYVFQYRPGGRSVSAKRITLGNDEDGLTVAKARARAQACARALTEGRDPHAVVHTAHPRASSETWQIRLGFLAADIARLQNTYLRRTMKKLGASHAQWGMLGQLALHQGITQMDLAKILGLSKVAVTGLVNRVVRAGWAERRLDDRDRRVRRLFLTGKAKKAVAAMREKVDVMTGRSMGHISDLQGQEVVRVLEGIKERLQRTGKSR